MKTILTFRRLLVAATVILTSFSGLQAQEDDAKVDSKAYATMSLEQLNSNRAQLMSTLTSEEFKSKIHKIDEMKAPNDSGIPSLDNLAMLLGKIAGKVQENRSSLTSMYAGVTGLNYDGTTAAAPTSVNEQQLRSLSEIMLQLNGDIISTARSLVTMPGEIKSAGVFKAIKGLKNLLYIKNAVTALSAEIKYNNQLTQNLLATQKLKLMASNK